MNQSRESWRGRMRLAGAIWLNLAHKEWDEHKWRAVVVAAILLVYVLLVSQGSDVPAEFGFSLLLAMVATIFIAMGVVAGEQSDGSLSFAHSLPVAGWRMATARLAVGACLCVAPMIFVGIASVITSVMIGSDSVAGELLVTTFRSAWVCLSLYCWITAFAIRQPTHLRVGGVGLLILFAWLSFGIAFDHPTPRNVEPFLPRSVVRFIMDLGPLGMMPAAAQSHSSIALPPGRQVLVMGVLFAFAVANYGRPQRAARMREPLSQVSLGRPRRSTQSAIVWLNCVEAIQVAFSGIIFTAALAVFAFGCFFLSSVPAIPVLRSVGPLKLLSTASLVLGFAWMAIIAVATFSPALQPELFTFLRSRPIDLSEWFWSKFWLGAVIGIGCLNAPAILAISITTGREWISPAPELAGYSCTLLAHLMIYSVAVLAACLLRNVVQASILGCAVPAFVVGIPANSNGALELLEIRFAKQRVMQFVENGLPFGPSQTFDFLPFIVLMILLVIGPAVAASHIVHRDIACRP